MIISMKHMKTVSPLTEHEKNELDRLVAEDLSARTRARAEAILLSSRGFSIGEIAKIKNKHIITVSRWIGQWEERGVDGILEGEGRGRKKSLTEDEFKQVAEWLGGAPRSAKAIADKIEKTFGKVVSRDTVRRILKGAGKVWKRVRASLGGDRDEDSFRLCEQELAEHLEAAARGEIKLLYLDESGFNGESYIPYAWQDKGATLEMPCPRGKRINVLGVLSIADAKLEVEMVTGKMTSQNVLGKLDGIAGESSTADIPYVAVLDNASIHTAKVIEGMRPEWGEKGLLLYFLPT
jgi:transposase